MLLPAVFTLLFLAASLPVVVAPLRRQRATVAQQAVAARATEQDSPPAGPSAYEKTLLALRDLEFDHELGLVADDDYDRLHEKLVLEAASALQSDQQEKDEVISARIEAAIRSRRRQPQGGRDQVSIRFCPQCGQPVDRGDRFCTACGASLT